MTSVPLASPQPRPLPSSALRQTLLFPGRRWAGQERSSISGGFHLSAHPKSPQRPPSPCPSPWSSKQSAFTPTVRSPQLTPGQPAATRGRVPPPSLLPCPAMPASSENSPQDSRSSRPLAALPAGCPGDRWIPSFLASALSDAGHAGCHWAMGAPGSL